MTCAPGQPLWLLTWPGACSQPERLWAVTPWGGRGTARVSLGPLDVEDEVVVAEAGHPGNGASGVLAAVEADEGKALGEGVGSGTLKAQLGPMEDPSPPPGHQPTLDWPVVLSFAR